MAKQMYKQVVLQYEDKAKEQCWIQSELAKVGKKLYLEDDKTDRAIVLEAFDSVILDREELDMNRKYPLRKATDI